MRIGHKPGLRLNLVRCVASTHTLVVTNVLAFPVSAQEPPPAFAPCTACHSPHGKNGLGPSLHGVYGRKAGTLGGFTYSGR